MSASWLITDGFSGEANGVSKIVTLGLYSDMTAPAAPTFDNNTQNWLSPSLHLAFLFGVGLVLLRGLP